jgi:hypothetical protein
VCDRWCCATPHDTSHSVLNPESRSS